MEKERFGLINPLHSRSNRTKDVAVLPVPLLKTSHSR